MNRIRCLATQWMPTAALGAESLRERAASSALPPLYFLHVWWARRPLILARAAVLASLLPAWNTAQTSGGGGSQDLLIQHFGTEEKYRQWFLEVLGIKGDPVAARKRIAEARSKGVRFKQDPYGYKRAFTVSPSQEVAKQLRVFTESHIAAPPVVLDLFGGGGSISFEAARYGCRAFTSELNPVAAAILHGTVKIPFEEGARFLSVLDNWGKIWIGRISKHLAGFFVHEDGEVIKDFIWAHTVPCPSTGHLTPLLPNHWLARTAKQREAVALHPDATTGRIGISILKEATQEQGDRQTYKRGVATSVFTDESFDGGYISKKAQEGEMGHLLLAVAYRPPNGRGTQFRAPVAEDLEAVQKAEAYVRDHWDEWDAQGLIPTEAVPEGNKTKEPLRYGMKSWASIFTPRQLLTAVIALEELHRVLDEARSELDTDQVKALNLYLAFALDKVVNYNSRMSRWHPPRMLIAPVFDRHDFAFKWTYAEMEGVDACRWGLQQVMDCYRDLAKLAATLEGSADNPSLMGEEVHILPGEPTLASATALPYPDRSVDAIVTDPPYYDNVMYAELSDYFYIWLKRSLKPHWPELCGQYLSDKDNEAVANRARFTDLATHTGRGKKPPGAKTAQDLAAENYETLMADAFAEAHRVLRDDGAMTVMFTHKKVDAWNALAKALLDAGFQIASSWPVTTESAHSLHQKGNNSANSTILLTCLKRRETSAKTAFWQEIQDELRHAARQAAIQYARDGLVGVDVTLAAFGPALAVLSEKWPVYTGELDSQGQRQQISPEQVLDLARQEVALAKLEGLAPAGNLAEFDPPTNWWLLAWHDFGAPKFPAGEAIKLSQATHMDLDVDLRKGYRLVATRSGTAEILSPMRRWESNCFAFGLGISYETWIDRLHALMVAYEQDGLQVARAWLAQTNLAENDRFRSLLEAALRAIPRTKDTADEILIPEARTLEGIRATLFPQVAAPPEPEEEATQPDLYAES